MDRSKTKPRAAEPKPRPAKREPAKAEPAKIENVDFASLRRCLAALSDPTRQQMVTVLSRERLNVSQLTERFPLSQPAISHHLRILTSTGILVQERHGRERVYRLDRACCEGLADQFRNFMAQCCANARCC